MTTFEGSMIATTGRYAIVCSRFNDLIVVRLLDGAVDALTRHGVAPDDIDVAWAPGAWELPVVAQRLARSGSYVAIVCLGAVIRGATAHFEHIAGQCAAGLQRVALESDMPVTFGVLTTETIDQAIERSGTNAGNKGAEAALAALKTTHLLGQLPRR
ncbi:MAG: 6,7-dimethyl-8-ribityllumazine synthase [Actinomycetota bacterium]